MTNDKRFWQALMAVLLALYATALLLAAQGATGHVLVRLAAIVLIAHVLELPLAFYLLKGRNPQAARAIVATLLFGGIWWVPARKGVFAVS
jgi:hypothetical protein